MSFILDALRKSEIERQRQSGPNIAELPLAREDRRLPVALVAIGLLLAVNVGVLLFFLLRDGAPEAAVEPAAIVAPPPAAAAPAAAPPTTTAALQPAPATGTASTGTASTGAASPSVVYEESPEIYPSQGYAEPATTAFPDPTLLPDAPPATSGGTVSYGEEPQQGAVPVESVAGMPPLSVDLHIFSDNPAKRAVFINGRRYTQGATIAEGALVEEITRDGVILSFRGRRFLLPRQ